MFGDDGYTTPEGFWLHKPLLMPDVRRFDEVLEYRGEWDQAHIETAAVVMLEGNELGPYCSMKLIHDRYRSIQVWPQRATVAALADQLVTRDDRLYWEIIEHKDRGRALVILQHNQIIGSRYMAYIDPASIPARPVP